jgi:hypothetical protein
MQLRYSAMNIRVKGETKVVALFQPTENRETVNRITNTIQSLRFAVVNRTFDCWTDEPPSDFTDQSICHEID